MPDTPQATGLPRFPWPVPPVTWDDLNNTINNITNTTGEVLNGHGAPSAAPSGNAAVYTDVDTNILYQWNGSAWV